jgi:hypothetical protein
MARPERAYNRTDGHHGSNDVLHKRLGRASEVLVGLDTPDAGHGRYVEAEDSTA